MLSNHLIIGHFLLLLPSVFPSSMVFSNELTLYITWPKYWKFSFSISSSNDYSGLISFRIDWFGLIPVHGTLMSLLQHHNLKESILQCLLLLLLSLFSRVRLCATPQTAAQQAPPSLGFSRQEHWSGLPFPSPVHESEVAQSCPTPATPWTAAYQTPPSMRFSRQKYWSGVPLLSPLQCLAFFMVQHSQQTWQQENL